MSVRGTEHTYIHTYARALNKKKGEGGAEPASIAISKKWKGKKNINKDEMKNNMYIFQISPSSE